MPDRGADPPALDDADENERGRRCVKHPSKRAWRWTARNRWASIALARDARSKGSISSRNTRTHAPSGSSFVNISAGIRAGDTVSWKTSTELSSCANRPASKSLVHCKSKSNCNRHSCDAGRIAEGVAEGVAVTSEVDVLSPSISAVYEIKRFSGGCWNTHTRTHTHTQTHTHTHTHTHAHTIVNIN